MKEAVFLWLWRFRQPYLMCEDVTRREEWVAEVLVHLRKDNSFGVTGGRVDEGESLIEALVREVKEETNLEINRKYLKTIKPLLSIEASPDTTIHSFFVNTMLVREEMLSEILEKGHTATHFNAECGGFLLLRFDAKELVKKGINSENVKTAMSLPWSGTSFIEFKKVISLIQTEWRSKI